MHGFNLAPVLLCFAVALTVHGHALPPRDAFLVGSEYYCLSRPFNTDFISFTGQASSSDDASSSTSAAPSSSSSASSTPYILFSTVSTLTTCSTGSINWLYVGPSDTMSLTVTNRGVLQGGAPASSSSAINTLTDGSTDTTLVERAVPTGASVTSSASDSTATATVTEKIAASLDPYALTFNWSSVNVPQGWYRLVATVDTSIAQSDSFYVSNGLDTSCILLASSSSSSSTTSSATSTPTTSSVTSANGATGNNSGSRVNKGAIAGGVIGGVALLAAIIAVFVNYRLCRPASATGSPRSPRRSKGAWGGLGSVDTTYSSRSVSQSSKLKSNAYAAAIGAGARGDKYRSQSESIGPILESQTNINSPNPNIEVPTPGTSNEDVNSINLSPFEEKYPVNEAVDPFSGTDAISALPLARPNNARQSSGSTSSGNHNYAHSQNQNTNNNRESQTYAPNNNFSRPRSTSDHQLKSPRRVSVDYSKYPGLDLTPTSPSRNDYPPPMSAAMSRSSSGGARRTPRKPVPAYTPDISQSFAAHAPSPARARAHTTRDYAAPDMPSDASFIATATDADGSSVRSGRSGRSGTTASHTHGAGMPELNHKSSFGDMRPVHYLIPDMPPPSR